MDKIKDAINRIITALKCHTEDMLWVQAANTRTGQMEDRLFFALDIYRMLNEILDFIPDEQQDVRAFMEVLKEDIPGNLQQRKASLKSNLEKVMYHTLISPLDSSEMEQCAKDHDILMSVFLFLLDKLEKNNMDTTTGRYLGDTVERIKYERYQKIRHPLVQRKIHNSFNILSPYYFIYWCIRYHQKENILSYRHLNNITGFILNALDDKKELTLVEMGYCLLLAEENSRLKWLQAVCNELEDSVLYKKDYKPFFYYLDGSEGNFQGEMFSSHAHSLVVLLYGLMRALYNPFDFGTCLQETVANKSFFAGKYLLASKRRASLIIKSNCMNPVLCEGDTVIVEPFKKEGVKKEDILVFKHCYKMLAHKISDIIDDIYITSSLQEDFFLNYPVFSEEILGSVVAVQHQAEKSERYI